MSEYHIKLAKLLRTTPDILVDLDDHLKAVTGKKDVVQKIVLENDILVNRTLNELGLHGDQSAEDVYKALTEHVAHVDHALYKAIGITVGSEASNTCGMLCSAVENVHKGEKGFFIKKDRVLNALKTYHPTNLLSHFGYSDVQQLIDEHDFSSIISSLRFVESTEWMHAFFEHAYSNLAADDFEERPIELRVLDKEWVGVAEKFLEKKYHNVSHLKELGIIFIIPFPLKVVGESLRLLMLLLHYFNEIDFYSSLFRQYASMPNFSSVVKSLLRGDVAEDITASNPENKYRVRIIQRYLAKDDPNDARLSQPHINPEGEHWYRAGNELAKLQGSLGDDEILLAYWAGLNAVGNFFHDGLIGEEKEVLISFNLLDIVLSLLNPSHLKLQYHHQEALWNKLFVEYLGREKFHNLMKDNLIRGFISL